MSLTFSNLEMTLQMTKNDTIFLITIVQNPQGAKNQHANPTGLHNYASLLLISFKNFLIQFTNMNHASSYSTV